MATARSPAAEMLSDAVTPLRFKRRRDDRLDGATVETEVDGVSVFLRRGADAPSTLFLTQVLTMRCRIPPAAVAFTRSAYGEPLLTTRGPAAPPAFSLSRAGDWRGIAVADAGRIGIDMETAARVAANATPDDVWLSPDERRALKAAPRSRLALEIACRWVLKEAYSKVRGVGLNLPFGGITFAARNGAIEARADDADETACLAECAMTLARSRSLLVAIVRRRPRIDRAQRSSRVLARDAATGV